MDDNERITLLDRLRSMPDRVQALAHAVPAAHGTWRPGDGQFSLVEHLCHLRDLEAEGYQVRIRRLLEEDLPTLQEIDGSTWAVERDYQSQPAADALASFTRLRAQTVEQLVQALPRHGSRKGLFGGFGIITLAQLAQDIARHDAGHLQEIEALAWALEEKEPSPGVD